MRDNMKIMGKWFESCEGLEKDAMQEVCYWVVMHSIYGKEVEGVEHKDAKLALNFIIPQIDNMIKAYDEKVERGSKGGRPKKIDDDEVYKLALQGMKGPTIAKELGCGKSSIYDNAGWKRAQKELFRKPEIFPVRKLKEFSE